MAVVYNDAMMIGLSRTVAIGVLLLGCRTENPAPRLRVEAATWHEVRSATGCVQHALTLNVETIGLATVTAQGVSGDADDSGKVTLEVPAAAIGGRAMFHVRIKGAQLEVPVPPRPRDARPVELGAVALTEGVVVWRGEATGAIVGGKVDVVGVLDNNDARFRFAGCDLRGGKATRGLVNARAGDEIEIRYAIVPRLVAATSLAPITEPLAFEVENLDGVTGTVTLRGGLDVAAALTALQALAAGARVADAPPWHPGQPNPVLVVGPGLGEHAETIARADALLMGQPIGRAAAVVALDISQVASERVCSGASAPVPTTKALIKAQLLSRATGDVIMEQAFENEADCAGASGATTIAAGPPWPAILDWLESLPSTARPQTKR